MKFIKPFNIVFIFFLSVLILMLFIPSNLINSVQKTSFETVNVNEEEETQHPQYYGVINEDNYWDGGKIEIYMTPEMSNEPVAEMMLVEGNPYPPKKDINLSIKVNETDDDPYNTIRYSMREIQDSYNYEYIPTRLYGYDELILTQDHTVNSAYSQILVTRSESGSSEEVYMLNLEIEDGIINTLTIHQSITEYGSEYTFDKDMTKFVQRITRLSSLTTTFFEFEDEDSAPIWWYDDFSGIQMSFSILKGYKGGELSYNTWDNVLNTQITLDNDDGQAPFKIYSTSDFSSTEEVEALNKIVRNINNFFPKDTKGRSILVEEDQYLAKETNNGWSVDLSYNDKYYDINYSTVYPEKVSMAISSVLLQENFEYTSFSVLKHTSNNDGWVKIIQLDSSSELDSYTFVGVIVYWVGIMIIILSSILFIVLYYFRRRKYV